MRFLRFPAARLVTSLALALLAGGIFLAGSGSTLHAQTGAASVNLQSGWNLVALPPGTPIPGITPPLYTYQPGDTAYETPASTQTGLGYWAYAGSATTLALPIGSSSAYSVTAPAGQYFMVGDPSGILAATVSGADVVYSYDATNGYQATTTLNPGQGAWVYSTNGGTITVTPFAPNQPPSGAQPPAARFFGTVTVHGQPATSGTITATSSTGATCGTSSVGAAPATNANSYALDITGGDPSCSTVGSTISFSVAGAAANPSASTAITAASPAIHVDLSVP